MRDNIGIQLLNKLFLKFIVIMEAFVELLDEEDWLTDETKAFAKQKV